MERQMSEAPKKISLEPLFAVPLVVGDKPLARAVIVLPDGMMAFGLCEKDKPTSFQEEGRFDTSTLMHWIELILSDDDRAKKVDKIVKKIACGAAAVLVNHGYLTREPGE